MDYPEIKTKGEDVDENKNNDEQNVLKEIKVYLDKNILIITKELGVKIPLILSFIQNEKNQILNKLKIIKYLTSLIKYVPYNLDIILAYKSKEKLQLNLYEIIIEQYIYTDKKQGSYIKNLEELLNLIFNKLSYNKEVYRYILSHISDFLNKKNNNDSSELSMNLNEYNYSQILKLIHQFYQSKKDEKPFNFLFFNGNKDTNLTIPNTNELLDLKYDLYILSFIKLIDYEYLSALFENNKDINRTLNLIEINFENNTNIFKINIDYSNSSLTTDYKENLNCINIPYNLFNKKESNNFLVKITTDNQIEIFINGKDINIPKNTSATKNIALKNIIFSGEFYGIISSIMIYNNKKRNKTENIIPSYFLEKQPTKKEDAKFVFANFYKDGFDEENLLTPFVRADMKDRVHVKNIYDTSLSSGENKNNPYIDEIQKFMSYNLISLYIPTRMIIENEKGNKKIILVDSISNLNAVFNINELYSNLAYSKFGGLSLLKNLLTDFSVDLNGINHLLPCIEVMINYPELLSSDNFSTFMSIILNLILNFKHMISSKENNNFFYLLSQFLEKIPEERKSDLHAFITSILLTLQSFETEASENKLFYLYIQDFFNNVCMNERILYKFNYDERSLIYKKIYEFLINESKINIDINITNIINILLSLEKNKYSHFCCKKHAQYFNKDSQIMEPELTNSLQPILNIIQIIFNQYENSIKNCDKQKLSKAYNEPIDISQSKLIKLYEILTFDVTPCMQSAILKLYFEFFKKNNDQNLFDCLNIKDNIIIITLLVFKTSLFDVKELAFNYLIDPINKNKNRGFIEKLAKYVTYYYYPRNKANENLKAYPKSINIDKINYVLSEPNEYKKKLIENYDKKHYYEIMKNIFNKSKEIFLAKPIQGYFNVLLSIASKCDYNFIIEFLIFVKEILNKKVQNNINHYQSIKNNSKLIPYLLDTCYQSYLIKYTKEQNIEFNPGFDLDDIKDEKEKTQIIDNIISLSSNILLDLFILDIYKLDYLMTWCKYYYTLEDTENKYKHVRKFVFEFFLKKIIENITSKQNSNASYKPNLGNVLYLINIIFEYMAYHRTSGFEMMGKLKNFESLYQQLCPSFAINLFYEIQKEEQTKEMTKEKIEEDSIYLLHEKWDEYDVINSLMDNAECLGYEEDFKLKEDKKIFVNYILAKENKFNSELKKFFIKVNEIEHFKKNQNSFFDCNKGMEYAIIKFHYYTLLLNIVTNSSQFKGILNNLRYFILVIIIATTTVTIVNPKNANNKSEMDSYPNEAEYKNLQLLVRDLLFNIISFLKDKIVEMDKKLETYKSNLDDSKNKSFYDNYNSIKHYLINTILIILKILGNIYKHVKQTEISKRKNSSAFKGMFNKIKKFISPDKEGMHLTGGYYFISKFIETCLGELNSYESGENEVVISTFLDDIPEYPLNSIDEVAYVEGKLSKTLEDIYQKYIANNQKISDFLSIDKERYQRLLFHFVHFILKRNELICYLIPTYDNSCNFKLDYNYLCLKPYYLPAGPSNFVIENKNNYGEKLIQSIRMYQIEQNYYSNNKIRQYRKIKKKLFSFNGIFSTRKYFYDKNKYICKYKLLDHMTEDFTRILLTPIIDVDYYLPVFSKFEVTNLFRDKNQNNLIQIKKIANLSLEEKLKEKNKDKKKPRKKEKEEDTSEKEGDTKETEETEKEIDENSKEKVENNKEAKNEIIPSQNYNSLYLLRQSEYQYMDELNKDIEGSLYHYKSYKNYIMDKHKIKTSYHFCIEDCCYVKTAFHIRGFFYVNDREIGFYSYDKIPYKIFIKKSQRKKEDEAYIYSQNYSKDEIKQINEIQKDYDAERKSCFGSSFSPQKYKYDYFHFSIPYDQIAFIFKRRYYYKICCLEFFATNKKTYFFKFDHTKLESIVSNIKHHINPKPEDILIEYKKYNQEIGFINPLSEINNMNKKLYKKGYMNLKKIYEKWQKWDISTMNLLMIMNIYSNRTYNDMNQYPIFPWIFTDYKSEAFPEKFIDKIRPMDKPMGMLETSEESKERKKEYLAHWDISRDDDNDDEEENYGRYGSHYSTSLYATYYLFRIFPFANIRIELQGTSFDDPNRLFNSVDTSWECSSTQKSDLRELIPELFCCPEILLNNNDFNLGEIRDINGPNENSMKLLQGVDLPKWCKNDAYLFIKKHRELLESNEVSISINKWFNLIFGSKQKGAEANKIHNLFSVQSYEEDYEKIYDELPPDEKDIACRMLEFGVTPNQILKSDASQRKVELEKYIKNKLFFHTLLDKNKLKNNEQGNKTRFKLEEINYEFKEDIKMKFNPNKIYYFPKDNNYENIKKNAFEIYVMDNDYLNIFVRKIEKQIVNKEGLEQNVIINDEGIGNEFFDEIAIKTMELKQNDKIRQINFKHGINSNLQPRIWMNYGSILVKGGYWNGNIILQNFVKDKDNRNIIKESNTNIYIYTTNEYSPIMKILIDKNETLALCGNLNGTVYIFRIKTRNKFDWTLYKTINDLNSPIVSMAIHETLNIAIICSENGLCMLYTLPYFKLYNSFILRQDDKDNNNDNILLTPDIVFISDSPLPCFVFYVNDYKTLYFYSVNGKLLSKHILNYEINEKSIKLYRDYQFVDYLVLYNFEKKCFEIRSMIEFELIGSCPVLNEFYFIDFTFSWDLEHILVFGKQEGKYKLFIIYDIENNKINWK